MGVVEIPKNRLSILVFIHGVTGLLCLLYLRGSLNTESLSIYIHNRTIYFHYLAPNITTYLFFYCHRYISNGGEKHAYHFIYITLRRNKTSTKISITGN